MAHGGGMTFGHARRDPRRLAGGPAPLDPRGFRGYSYLFGTPADKKRSTWGEDLDAAREVFRELYNVLPQGPAPDDNTDIPSGYTYLLQLVGHDLVESTEPLWVAADANIPISNVRAAALQLDTLYGGGPTVCPLAFAPGAVGTAHDYSVQLRLGRVRDADQLQLTGQCPFRDVARVTMTVPKSTDHHATAAAGAPAAPYPTANFDNPAQIYVADPRNGEGVILSQVVVLFSILHNAIAGKLSDTLPAPARFAYARTAVMRMYHSIIRNDLLKRLLHEGVYGRLNARPASSADWLWHGSEIPYELSHGAFRIGHGMARSSYDLNEQPNPPVRINQLLDAINGALPSNWVVAWSKFFDLGGTPNYAKKFAATQNLALNGSNVLPSLGPDTPLDVSLRDWLSAAAARMLRTDALIEAAEQHYPGMQFLRPGQITTWLESLVQQQENRATRDILLPRLQALAVDLPLPLYVMLESEVDPQLRGRRIGPLGSIIIGEVVFKRLAEEQATAETSPLTTATRDAVGAANWAEIDAVTDMPDLVRLAEKWGKLDQCQSLPFVAASNA